MSFATLTLNHVGRLRALTLPSNSRVADEGEPHPALPLPHPAAPSRSPWDRDAETLRLHRSTAGVAENPVHRREVGACHAIQKVAEGDDVTLARSPELDRADGSAHDLPTRNHPDASCDLDSPIDPCRTKLRVLRPIRLQRWQT